MSWKKGGGSESTIIIGPSKSVLVYALHSLEYVLGLARFRSGVRAKIIIIGWCLIAKDFSSSMNSCSNNPCGKRLHANVHELFPVFGQINFFKSLYTTQMMVGRQNVLGTIMLKISNFSMEMSESVWLHLVFLPGQKYI